MFIGAQCASLLVSEVCVKSVTEAGEKLGKELLVDRRKAACISLLMKIIGDDRQT